MTPGEPEPSVALATLPLAVGPDMLPGPECRDMSWVLSIHTGSHSGAYRHQLHSTNMPGKASQTRHHLEWSPMRFLFSHLENSKCLVIQTQTDTNHQAGLKQGWGAGLMKTHFLGSASKWLLLQRNQSLGWSIRATSGQGLSFTTSSQPLHWPAVFPCMWTQQGRRHRWP